MSSSEPRRPRRWLKRIVLIGLALVALLVGGPIVAGPFVGRRIVGALEERLAARARLESLELRAPGTARLRNFQLTDLDDAPVLSVDRLDVSAGVLAAALGTYRAEVTLDGFELHLRPRADGRWNVQALPRAGTAAGSVEGGDQPQEPATPVPDVRAHVRVGSGRVVVHTPEGPCGLEELALELDVRSLEEAAPFSLSGRFFGPRGDAGTVELHGELTAAAGGFLGPDGLRADGQLALGDVLLDALSPAIALLVPASSIEGRLAGNLELELGRDLALVGDGSLVVTSLRARGPSSSADGTADAREPLAVERVELTLAATRPGETTGALELRLSADDLVALEVAAAMEGSPLSPSANGELTAELALRADAGGLVGRLAGWIPLEGDNTYGGALSARANLSMRTEAGELAAITALADVEVADFAATGADGHSIDVGELASAKLDVEASYDLARGTFSLPRLELLAGPIEAHGNARLRGLGGGSGGPSALAVDDSELRAEIDLERLRASLAALGDAGDPGAPPDFGGVLSAHLTARQEGDAVVLEAEVSPRALRLGESVVDCAPLLASATLAGDAYGYGSTGTASCAHLAVRTADRPELSQDGLELEWQARMDRPEDGGDPAWRLSRSRLRTDTLEVSASGALSGPASPDLLLEVESGVDRLLADLGEVLGLAGHRGSGEVHSTFRLRPDGQRIRGEGELRVSELVFELPPPANGRLEEPELALAWSGAWLAEAGELELEKAELRSSFLDADAHGRISGVGGGETPLGFEELEGRLSYVPDELGVLLEPWLPGRLSGAEREECSFALEGPAVGVDPMTLLASARGNAHLGLGLFETTGIATDGQVELNVADGRAQLRGELGANGGALTFVGDLAAPGADASSEGPGGRLVVEMQGVRANSAMSPLLERVHPAFASFEGVAGGELSGLVNGSVELQYDAPLPTELLAGGWEALPKDPISGHGSLSIDGAVLRGSPLFGELLGELGVDASESLDLAPVRFRIASGRLVYDDPWTWSIGGSPTTFTGSIGLDQSLDMTWSVPITAKLVRRHGLLEALEGETVSIPITGTVRRPRVAFDGVLAGLARQTLQKELTKKLDLGKLLGVRPETRREEQPAKPSAQELLVEANQLWQAGKRQEAVVIYERLLDEFSDAEIVQRYREAIADKIRRGGG